MKTKIGDTVCACIDHDYSGKAIKGKPAWLVTEILGYNFIQVEAYNCYGKLCTITLHSWIRA